MARDRYERRHRRTAKNVRSVEAMAGADFDAVPSLSEAMGLEEPSVTYTHVGYVHCGAKLWGHRVPKAGRRHALNGGPTAFVALCGEKVAADLYDDFGGRRGGGATNVWEAGREGALGISCRRCLRLIGG